MSLPGHRRLRPSPPRGGGVDDADAFVDLVLAALDVPAVQERVVQIVDERSRRAAASPPGRGRGVVARGRRAQ